MTDGEQTRGTHGDVALASFDAFAADRDEARFTEWLRARNQRAWTAATRHRFVRELGAGDLPDAVYRRYLVQDAAFVDDLVSAFGHAVGEAPSSAARSRLVDFLGTLTGDENDYFERAFDALDVPADVVSGDAVTFDAVGGPGDARDSRAAGGDSTSSDLVAGGLAEPTRAFRDLLGRATAFGYPELLAVLAPAEWVYRDWATHVQGNPPERWYLAEWVELHANPAFESFVAWLRDELDREGAAASSRRQRRLAELFERTVDLEVAFFDAAYDVVEDDANRERAVSRSTNDGGGDAW